MGLVIVNVIQDSAKSLVLEMKTSAISLVQQAITCTTTGTVQRHANQVSKHITCLLTCIAIILVLLENISTVMGHVILIVKLDSLLELIQRLEISITTIHVSAMSTCTTMDRA